MSKLRGNKVVVLRYLRGLYLLIVCVFIAVTSVLAKDNQTASQLESTKIPAWHDQISGFAIGGFDPVTYFTRGEPKIGHENYQLTLNKNAWKFYNIGNMEAFRKHPQLYSPNFAGYDTFALANGTIVRGAPIIWIIRNDRLYFFHNVVNLRLWLDDPDKYLAKAKENLPKLSAHLASTIPLAY